MIKGLKRIGRKIAMAAVGIALLSPAVSPAQARPFPFPARPARNTSAFPFFRSIRDIATFPPFMPIRGIATFPYRPVQSASAFPLYTPIQRLGTPLSRYPSVIQAYLFNPYHPSLFGNRRFAIQVPWGYAPRWLPQEYGRWPEPYFQPQQEQPRLPEYFQPQEQLPGYLQSQPQQQELPEYLQPKPEELLEEKVEQPLSEEESDRALEETLDRLGLSYALNIVYEHQGEEIEMDAVVPLPDELVGIFYLGEGKQDSQTIDKIIDMCQEKNVAYCIFFPNEKGKFVKHLENIFQPDEENQLPRCGMKAGIYF